MNGIVIKVILGAITGLLGLTGLGQLGKALREHFRPHASYVDPMDCYFDKECHGKVQWDEVGKLKEGFFTRLKIWKEKQEPKEVTNALTIMHQLFAKAGVPEDRIDHILVKWVEVAYPEALDTIIGKSSVSVNGFQCQNGYGEELNQKYDYQGTTKDGRPYYRGVDSPDHYIYYDHYCAADSKEPRWLLGGKPDATREHDLNEFDGEGCSNDFSIVTDSRHLPAGPQQLAWKWCGDAGDWKDQYASITYQVNQPETDTCSKYQDWGKNAVEGCHHCETDYAGKIEQCMQCGKECTHICPDGGMKCFDGPKFVSCHLPCMEKNDPPSDECSKYKDVPFGTKVYEGCLECAKWYPGMADKCMSCGAVCSSVCPHHDTKCYHGAKFGQCSGACMKKPATKDECGVYKDIGKEAFRGCQDCARRYPGKAEKCMKCGQACHMICPSGGGFWGKCYKSSKYVACSVKCNKADVVIV